MQPYASWELIKEKQSLLRNAKVIPLPRLICCVLTAQNLKVPTQLWKRELLQAINLQKWIWQSREGDQVGLSFRCVLSEYLPHFQFLI